MDAERRREYARALNHCRPCIAVSCKYHLAIDVTDHGSLKLNFPDVPIEDMRETCALDVADRGGVTLEEVGVHTGVTRERVRQLETVAMRTLRARLKYAGVDGPIGGEPEGWEAVD